MTPKKAPEIPQHLREDTRQWYASVVNDYLLDTHHLKLLQAAGEAWDEAQRCREILASEGLTFADRFRQIKPRPEAQIEQNAMIRFARLLRELRLDESAAPDPRPPRTRGRH
jgi:hypothetical protein